MNESIQESKINQSKNQKLQKIMLCEISEIILEMIVDEAEGAS